MMFILSRLLPDWTAKTLALDINLVKTIAQTLSLGLEVKGLAREITTTDCLILVKIGHYK